MAVCLRLKRHGRTNRAFWRLCATDRLKARDGRVLEELGHYDPEAKNPDKIKIHRERVRYWLSVGAQPSPTVEQLLRHIGLDRKGNEVQPRPWKKRRPQRKKAAGGAPAEGAAPAAPKEGQAT